MMQPSDDEQQHSQSSGSSSRPRPVREPSPPPIYRTNSPAPPAVLASRGLSGILDGQNQPAALDVSKLPKNVVLLNVYDVSDSELLQRINKVFTANDMVLVGGVFHAGVEVYGHEWCFGATTPGRTGVGAVSPRTHPQHRYRATVPMGTTNKSPQEIMQLVTRMAGEWPGCEYHLLHRNCLNFCNAFLDELQLRHVPGWVDRAARVGSQLDTAVKLVKSLNREGALEEVQQQAMSALETLRQESALTLKQPLSDLSEASEQAYEALMVLRRDSAAALEQPLSEVSEFGTMAKEIAQEQFAALGAGMWQLGEDLGLTKLAPAPGGAAIAPEEIVAGISNKVLDFHANAKEFSSSLWQWGQGMSDDFIRSLDSPADTPSARPTANRAESRERAGRPSQSGAPPAAANGRGTNGMIRAQEQKSMRRGLLEVSDEDEPPPRRAEVPVAASLPLRAVSPSAAGNSASGRSTAGAAPGKAAAPDLLTGDFSP